MANAQNIFDFQSFTQDHQLSTLISGVTDLLSEGADPALVQKIKDFKAKFKLPDAQGDTPEFQFNLTTDTYEEVPAKCFKDGKDLKKVTFVQADRFFVSDGYNENAPQKWKEVACPSTVDIHQESAQLTFLDCEKKHVDWPQTLNNLNEMIKTKLYSEKMMKACLLRFINHYESGQLEYLKDRTCNEIAKFLLSLDYRIDKTMFHKSRLHSSVRLPEETLSSAVIKVRNIVDRLHPLPAGSSEHDSNSIANRYLINAIISFLRDDLAVPLLNRVQQDSASSRLLYYTEYLNMAMNAEARGQIFPVGPLKYGRKLNYGINPIMMLNNIEISKEKIYVEEKIPSAGNDIPSPLKEDESKRKETCDQEQKSFSSSDTTENIYEQLNLMSIALQKVLNLNKDQMSNSHDSTKKFERGRTEYRSNGSQSQNSDSDYVRDYSGNRQNNNSGNYQRNDYQNRGRSSSPYSRDRRDISRDRSQEYKRLEQRAYNSYPKMKKGYNCSPGYNPIITKKCSKCSNPSTHHEFECRVYEEWNENTCTLCEKYHHFSKSCKEISRFPPKNADNNSVKVN